MLASIVDVLCASKALTLYDAFINRKRTTRS
jgi:hypothetical protein